MEAQDLRVLLVEQDLRVQPDLLVLPDLPHLRRLTVAQVRLLTVFLLIPIQDFIGMETIQ
jgi:hypothetical protein